jgi:hypothetical protein
VAIRGRRALVNAILKKSSLVLFGVVCALIAFEVVAAIMLKMADTSDTIPMRMADGTLEQFEFDENLGFFPIVGKGGEYGPYGCLANEYNPENKGSRSRVVFIGDSVTHRAAIIDGLRALYGEDEYEYWNAGVESFNTRQIVEYYRLHNSKLEPDEVVLTFHNNDFQATPVATKEDGKLVLHIPQKAKVEAPFPLLGRSALYRLWLQYTLPRFERGKDEVKRDLAQLKELTEAQGARFSVVLYPILKPQAEWTEGEQRSRRQSLEIFDELGIRYFDILEALPTDAEQLKSLRQDPEDTWHPSPQGGTIIAEDLHKRGLLEDLSKQ